MKKLLPFLNRTGLLFGLALFFTAFIPLFPKLPLFDVIQTWVYVRLEDLLVLATVFLLLFRIVRGKARDYHSPLTLPILLYLGVGAVSLVWALLFIFPEMGGILFPHLAVMHYARRFEYFALFFLGLAALAGRRDRLRTFLIVLTAASLLVFFYGLGQKLWGFPAFLTMNEEFAKGIPLRLPPTARIPATFGGHYDLAAFLVLVIPVFGSLALSVNRLLFRLIFAVTGLSLYVLLLLTASRVSFGVYLVAVTVMLFWSKKRWLVVPVVLLSFFLLNFVNTASDRFYKTLRFSDVIVDATTGRPVGTLEMLEGGTAVVKNQEQPDVESLPHGSEFIGAPTSDKTAVETIRFTRTDLLKTGAGEISTVSGSFLIQKAFVYDISITTRFQGQWPKAAAAFKRNYLLGSGYSSLSVASDGDYLRMLGETGILGAVTFVGIFTYFLFWFLKTGNSLTGLERGFVTGFAAGLVGLLTNAVLIDVFEASKVAFMFYLMLGIAVSFLMRASQPPVSYLRFLKRSLIADRAFYVYFTVAAFVLYLPSLGLYFTADDFTWLKWAEGENLKSLAGNFTGAGGFFYRPVPKLLYFLEYSFFWLKPVGYHVVSVLLFSLISVLVYLLTRLFKVPRFFGLVAVFWYVALSVHHENVIWISGQSSLLSALFLLAAVVFGIRANLTRATKRGYETASYLAALLSLISYDGMVAGPVVIVIMLTAFRRGFRKRFLGYLVLIPLYLVLRSLAGAVAPAGDYAVNFVKLPFNSAGNLAGYLASYFGGVSVIEQFGLLRDYFRVRPILLACLFLPVMAGGFYFRKFLVRPSRPALLFLAAVAALGVYLGLGNTAERYSLASSGFFALFLAAVMDWLFRRRRLVALAVVICVLTVSAAVNVRQLEKLHGDWAKAAEIVSNTLLSMKNEYFPLISNTEFAFVDRPIRYGRAWVFPAGLDDPLWHIFRINDYWFKTYSYPTLEEALANDGSRTLVAWYALEFDENYNLFRTKFDVTTIEKPVGE